MDISFFTTIFLFFLPLLLVIYIKDHKKGQTNLPPGPRKLPFIGNLHQLAVSNPYVVLAKLAAKYGPLMHLKLGENSAIVVSSSEVLQQVLKTNGTVFANRPQTLFAKYMLYDSGDIGFAPYSDYWIQMRKICTIELLSAKRVNSTYPIMEEEILRVCTSIMSLGGTSIDMKELFCTITCAISCRASVGRTCSTNDPNSSLLSLIEEISALTAETLNISELFPSLQLFLSYITGYKQKLVKVHQAFDKVLDEIVSEREASIEAAGNDNIDHKPKEQDLVDVLLRLKNNGSYHITRKNIKAIILDIFVGGTETAAATLEWAMSELIKNPTMMKKLQSEVRGVLKEKKNVEHSDIQNMKYLKSVVKETLRFHHPGPFSIPRESREECTIDGYVIPKKTTVLVNFYAISRNSQYWREPEKFDPERFMNIENNVDANKDITSAFTPFGAGKRICPGATLGTAMVELTLAKLFYHFDWKLPNGTNPEELDLDEKFSGLITRKNRLYLIATPYVSP